MPNRRPPPLNTLRVFEAAARRLSFADAAAELFVTPGAVSQQIKRLEAALGAHLFERTHRAVRLTAAGATLAENLHRLFADLNAALDEVSKPRVPALRVSVLPSFAAKWLAPRLHGFAARPGAVSVRLDASDRLVDLSLEPFDVCIRYGRGNYAGVRAERLLDAPVVAVCSPRLRLRGRPLRHLADLAAAPLLHDESALEDSVPNWPRWLAAAGVARRDANKGPVFSGIHLALEAAIAGQGVALGALPLVQNDLRNGRLVQPFEHAQPNAYAFWLLASPRRSREPAVRDFMRWLQREARATATSERTRP